MAVPISDKEFEYAIEHGTDALENLFEEVQIDIFDLKRKSVK
ncbi:suppressor of fused domain protein [Anaerospora hongkongensis]